MRATAWMCAWMWIMACAAEEPPPTLEAPPATTGAESSDEPTDEPTELADEPSPEAATTEEDAEPLRELGARLVVDDLRLRAVDQDAFLDAIELHSAALMDCATTRAPQHGGNVVVRLGIAPIGGVLSVNAYDVDLGLRPFADCLVRVCRGIHFPAPNGGTLAFADLHLRVLPPAAP